MAVAATGIGFAGASAVWDIGKSSLEAKKFHVPSWKSVGGGFAGALVGGSLVGSLFEAWRSKKEYTINSIPVSNKSNPFNPSTQAKSLSFEQIAADFADNGTLDGSTKSA